MRYNNNSNWPPPPPLPPPRRLERGRAPPARRRGGLCVLLAFVAALAVLGFWRTQRSLVGTTTTTISAAGDEAAALLEAEVARLGKEVARLKAEGEAEVARVRSELESVRRRAREIAAERDASAVAAERIKLRLEEAVVVRCPPRQQVEESFPLPSWRVATECSAYDLGCTTMSRSSSSFSPYTLETPPALAARSEVVVESSTGAAMARRVGEVSFESERAAWWRRATASDEAAVEVAARLKLSRAATRRAKATLENKETSLGDQLRRLFVEDRKFEGTVSWTTSDSAYAPDMLHDVASMARTTAGFGSKFFVTALDTPTLRGCAAAGLACVAAGLDEPDLRANVQNTKFRVSAWLATHDVNFVFFEMDVWFVGNAWRVLFEPFFAEKSRDILVAAHQNNPSSTNIGVYAVRASNATRGFFRDCLEEADAKPRAHDQLIFHNMLSWHRQTKYGLRPPAAWKDKPSTPPPTEPAVADHVPPHVGVCSTRPVPTERTLFVHTLGTSPLKAHHGKMIHAKELGVWHGLGRPRDDRGGRLPAYYGADAHDGRVKYLALDGRALAALTVCEREGYHNGRWLKAHLAILITFAKATRRVLVLPKIIADYHLYFAWIFLDLQSLEGLVDWRETNFPANRRAWVNRTHPFTSVVRVSLRESRIGLDDGSVSWSAFDPAASPDAAWNAWAAAVDRPEELLLLHDGFVDGDFVKVLTNCPSTTACVKMGVPAPFHLIYSKLRWCGETVDLDRHRIAELREAWNLVADKKSALSSKEVYKVYRALGLAPTEQEHRTMFKDMEPKHNKVEFSDFQRIMEEMLEYHQNEKVEEAFELFDQDRKQT
ncbi:hypothetical protein CTAYLR_000467 [Chrysophaeum taylorii]|uniref:EF-hand domain-containing protein n=1 Tax=Chrysophaeum taylorii TaxID=2483200 RepID=A0AAD7UG56_9STRA|nr:hypothetical protein CTAYLR_000467 [Chrysophaeum taylorii]